jgi:voltage-gated potassium channel
MAEWPSPERTMDEHQAKRQLNKDLTIALLALVSVAIGLYDWTHPRSSLRFTWLDVIDLGIVLVFVADFTYSAVESKDVRGYVRAHWFELPALLPITGNLSELGGTAAVLRGVRLVRLLRVVRLLRLIGAVSRTRHFWRKCLRVSRRAHVGRLAAFALVVIGSGSVLIWLLESEVNPGLRGFHDALWWAVNMFSNVAYVNFQPVTNGGRVVAAFLEFVGIGFIGLFTASLAGALLRESDEKAPPPKEPPLD